MSNEAVIIWFTGLSGAGKSTICSEVKKTLESDKLNVGMLDGDAVRNTYSKTLGFSRGDVLQNNLNICKLADDMRNLGHYDVILVPVISPYGDVRSVLRRRLGKNYFLVYCSATLDTVKKRDTKGLYKAEQDGKISDLIGVSDGFPYEPPNDADLILTTEDRGVDWISACAEDLHSFILSKLQ